MGIRPTPLAAALPLLLFGFAGCGGDAPEAGAGGNELRQVRGEGVEAISLLGEELRAPQLPPEVLAEYEASLASARAQYELAPGEVDAIIWLGRRTAYLGHFREAIDVYTRGLDLHPDDPRLLRHRGHRYITVREFDKAIEDLTRAVRLIEGTEDEVEPDGLPNVLGIPTSTLHFNVWYHLGLAHYLNGEFEQALLAWQACLEVSRHPDSVVATAYWLNNAMRRLRLDDRADALLADIHGDMEIIESTAYLEVLLLHKGERTREDLLGPTGSDATLQSTTTGYGVAMWHFVNGRREEAYHLMEGLLTNVDQWPAFGFIAAEADVARLDA